jgi:hypothetical protein
MIKSYTEPGTVGKEGGRKVGWNRWLKMRDAHFRLTDRALAKGGFGLTAGTWSIAHDSGEPSHAPHTGRRSSREASEEQ